jgi:SAM-dependent methyltransferase
VTEATNTTVPDLLAPEVGTVWDLCLSAEYDRERLVLGLAEWLGAPDGQQILDCACGTGFPALDLHRLGYNLTCTDGSPLMLERFRTKAKAADIALKPLRARWEELDQLYPARFDVVMCRGCSFIYAGTWDSEAEPDWSALECSVKSFVGCLRPGGRMYLDTTQEEDLLVTDPQWTEHPPRTIDGHRIDLAERVVSDPDAGVRRWMVQLGIDGVTYDFERKSHYLPHAELTSMLRSAGLEDVGRIDVTGERYAVFAGLKS